VARYDAGLVTSEVNVASGPLDNLRGVFDLMPLAGEEAASNIATRMHGVPTALAQLRQTLNEAAEHGHVAARRQLLEVAHHCAAWADPAQDDFWPGLARRAIAAGPLPETLSATLTENAEACRAATHDFGAYLRDELAQRGRENEAVGRELYSVASRYFLGAT